jgi:hypothetical protein
MSSVYNLITTSRPTGITVPVDGDTPIKAADVVPALQATGDLANNAIARLEPLATIAALAAILVPTNDLQRYVLGFGLYTFSTALTAISSPPFTVAATDGTPGKWVSEDYYKRIGSRTNDSFNFVWMKPTNPIGVSTLVTPAITNDNFPSPPWTDLATYVNLVSHVGTNAGSALAKVVAWDLDPWLVDNTRLEEVVAHVRGAGGHAGLPALMPKLAVMRYPNDPLAPATAPECLATSIVTDGSASAAAYDTLHTITFACSQYLDIEKNEYSYYVTLSNEGHTNASSGFEMYGFRLRYRTK